MQSLNFNAFQPFFLLIFSSISSKLRSTSEKLAIVRGKRIVGIGLMALSMVVALSSCQKEEPELYNESTEVPPALSDGFLYCSDYSGNFEIWK